MKNELMQRSSWLDARELIGNEVLGAHGTYDCLNVLSGEETTAKRAGVCVLKMNDLPDISSTMAILVVPQFLSATTIVLIQSTAVHSQDTAGVVRGGGIACSDCTILEHVQDRGITERGSMETRLPAGRPILRLETTMAGNIHSYARHLNDRALLPSALRFAQSTIIDNPYLNRWRRRRRSRRAKHALIGAFIPSEALVDTKKTITFAGNSSRDLCGWTAVWLLSESYPAKRTADMVFSIFQLLEGISASVRGSSSSLGQGYIPRGKQTNTSSGSAGNGGGEPVKPSGTGSGGQTNTSGGSATNSK
ncbi:hypothetical protein EV421DRAFT_1903272 [Armillaria borealis]|uniref:Uncharacterized protein n=1 Tax=Armillaria borealis TaxID=47425 RepID=A0AA39JLK4_9AGAR|nr:hypothetical protein EV421DRAFT_1903272 [Armillaria borealis]